MVSGIEAGALIGSTSIITIIIAKLRCYYKHSIPIPSCACGFTENKLPDNDDIHINTTTVNGVDLLYVGRKKTYVDEGYDSEDTRHTACPTRIHFN